MCVTRHEHEDLELVSYFTLYFALHWSKPQYLHPFYIIAFSTAGLVLGVRYTGIFPPLAKYLR